MKIHAEYTAQLRMQAGTADDDFDMAPGADLQSLLRAIAGRHGAGVNSLLFADDGQPAPTLLCFICGDQVDGNPTLSEGDTVTLMTPISGG